MSIQSWIKGKIKQREVRKLEPDVDFQFKENYYGDSNIIEGFNFIYCNNYTDKFTTTNKKSLSFISCVISLALNDKVLKDLSDFINYVFINKLNRILFIYNNISINIENNNVKLYLRGDIDFYFSLCNYIHNNIFTKYIRNNLFVEEISIETPNEYLDKMLNSINHPFKDIDILFIEDNIVCENFQPVIGLSIKEDLFKKETANYLFPNYITLNKRVITYIQLDKLTENELNYLINEVKYGYKLIDLLHLTKNDYLDIDEVIEE